MSVKRCQAEVDRLEFLEWVHLYEQEPWGDGREDVRMATIATLLGNIMSVIIRLGGGKAARAYGIEDFLPQRTTRQQRTPEQVKALLTAHFRSIGAF